MKSELHYWLALLRTYGIGCSRGRELLQAFPVITDLFAAPISTLINLGIPLKIANNIRNPPWDLVAKDIEWLSKPHHYLITFQNGNYPALLKQIPDAPLALFVAGNTNILNTHQIAIVGSRKPSHAGLNNAYNFASQLAALGITITSGFAIGIDTESHKGALDAKGKTIAVLGTGANIVYPQSNEALKQQILEQNGAIISEFPPGTYAKAENFPRRNRIISGLSLGVLIVEATIRSGSLITARLAAEQGREVFAIPGSISNNLAQGCHILIKQGAKLVENVNDILEELPSLISLIINDFLTFNKNAEHQKFTENKFAHKSANQEIGNISNMKNQEYIDNNLVLAQENLDNTQQKLLEYIDYDPTSMDILIERSGLSAQNISSRLLLLELHGHIKAVYGGYIKLKNNFKV